MKLSAKHGQQHITIADLTGGLNATTTPEMIGDNQLAEAINVELDRATGALKTVCGTAWIYSSPSNLPIRAMLYDKINMRYFFVSGRDVYRTNYITCQRVGALTGNLFPIYTDWEDGFLVASGGRLQYWNGTELLTLDKSPDVCNGVYIRAGRVFVYYDNTIRYSAMGNETDWAEDTNIESSGKFIEAGYKDGGKIIGLVNLSSDVLIIKDNNRVYRLSGEYPSWSIREVSRNLDCLNRLSFCAVTNNVFVLGNNRLQKINTTNEYGDMKAENVAQNVINLFYQLPLDSSRVIYLPSLHQIWITGAPNRIIVYDLNYNAYFERRFNSDIVDILTVGDTVYIAYLDKITQLMPGTFSDEAYSVDEKPLEWRFVTKKMVSFYNYLLKRARITYVPLTEEYISAQISIGKVNLQAKTRPNYPPLVSNVDMIYGNNNLIFPMQNQYEDVRCVYRDRCLDIVGNGKGSGMMLHKIEMEVTEV